MKKHSLTTFLNTLLISVTQTLLIEDTIQLIQILSTGDRVRVVSGVSLSRA